MYQLLFMAKETYRRVYLAYGPMVIEFIMEGKCGTMQQAWWQEEMTGHMPLTSMKQEQGTEVVCCLQTLKSPPPRTVSSNKAAPPKLPQTAATGDQVHIL